jgi:hypothetical protein
MMMIWYLDPPAGPRTRLGIRTSTTWDTDSRASEEDNNAALAEDYDLFVPEELLPMTDAEFVEPWQEEEILATEKSKNKSQSPTFTSFSSMMLTTTAILSITVYIN